MVWRSHFSTGSIQQTIGVSVIVISCFAVLHYSNFNENYHWQPTGELSLWSSYRKCWLSSFSHFVFVFASEPEFRTPWAMCGGLPDCLPVLTYELRMEDNVQMNTDHNKSTTTHMHTCTKKWVLFHPEKKKCVVTSRPWMSAIRYVIISVFLHEFSSSSSCTQTMSEFDWKQSQIASAALRYYSISCSTSRTFSFWIF